MNRLITLLIFLMLGLSTYFVISYSMEFPELTPIEETGDDEVDTNLHLSWVEYAAPSGKFSVSLPVMPQNAKKTVSDPDRVYDMYAAEKADQTIFMISLITFIDLKDFSTEAILKQVPDDILTKHPKATVHKMQMGTYEGFPSLNFSISDEKTVYDTKTFMDGNTLYILSRIAKAGNKDNNEYKKFIESFQLIREGVAK